MNEKYSIFSSCSVNPIDASITMKMICPIIHECCTLVATASTSFFKSRKRVHLRDKFPAGLSSITPTNHSEPNDWPNNNWCCKSVPKASADLVMSRECFLIQVGLRFLRHPCAWWKNFQVVSHQSPRYSFPARWNILLGNHWCCTSIPTSSTSLVTLRECFPILFWS